MRVQSGCVRISEFPRPVQSRSFPKMEKDRTGPLNTMSNKFATLTSNLPRRHASILIQPRTGHAPLNHHFAQIQKINSPSCQGCGTLSETVYHYLLICVAYRLARRRLELDIGRQRMRIEHLLTNNKSLPHFFHFLNRTKRLKHIFGSLVPPTQAQPDPPRLAEHED